MAKNTRMLYLLTEASKCFSDGYSPFNNDWLSEHKVTIDECGDLSIMIGGIVNGFARADHNTQSRIWMYNAASILEKKEQ